MADETPESVPAEASAPDEVDPRAATPGSRPGRFTRVRRATTRWTRRLLAVVIAVVAAIFVSIFTIDLGRFPQLKELAEREGTKYLERPLHIGGISALLSPGKFVLRDVVIDGKKPGDRPFLTSKAIYFNVPWWSLFSKELVVEVVVDDWAIVVEQWRDGHNMPKLMPKNDPTKPKRELPFTTTTFSFAHRGMFTYDDHVTPWRVTAPNLEFALVRDKGRQAYVGTASFSDGQVQILGYRPMRTDMSTRFALDGSKVHLRHLDLTTEGAVSHVTGNLDFGKWPEQSYQVSSRVDFATMKEIFFAAQSFRVSGEADFTGTFQLFKATTPQGTTQLRRDLRGEFTSELAGVNSMAFQDLHGALLWTNERFEVPHAEMQFQGGDVRLRYGMAPFGTPRPATVTFKADYADLDAAGLGPLLRVTDLNLVGRADGSLDLQWPNGHLDQMRGSGHTRLTPPAGTVMASVALPTEPKPARAEEMPFAPYAGLPTLAMMADVHYTFDPDGMSFDRGVAATEWTHIRFDGRTTRGRSEFPFEVTSHDWQESDRLLAVIMSGVTGRPTGAVEVGGRGTFTGKMTGSFSAPRVEGRFAGQQMRVWDVTWGDGQADLVIEGGYVVIAGSRITKADGVIVSDGRYSLGFRADTAEEIGASVQITNWPIADLREAFKLTDWPFDGTVGMLALDLSGRYKNMFGSGRMRIDRGVAWGEPFDVATGDLELEGSGMRVNRIEMHKGPGLVRGAARLGWRDGTYAFNADGERLPVESLVKFKIEKAPLSGVLRFRATGAGPFDAASYEIDATVADLFVADEGIGQVSGRMTVRNNVLTFERLTAASNRLQVSGSGSIQLNAASDADLQFRFQQTSIDPYLRLIAPAYSPYTRAIVSGSLDARGPLSDLTKVRATVTIDSSQLTLFDYELANDGPVQLSYENQVFSIGRLRLRGLDTDLQLGGRVDIGNARYDLSAAGGVSLAILQLRYPDLAASGGASIKAQLTGPFDKQQISGEATISNGRLRMFALQHSLDEINGPIRFDGAGINVAGLRARMGGGPIVFGGTIGMSNMQFTQFALTANGQLMQLRYPVGFTSTVNADLSLTGTLDAMRLGGNVDVIATRYGGSIDNENGLLGLAAGGALGGGGDDLPTPVATSPASGIPLALAVDIHVPSTNIIQQGTTRIEASGDLTLAGTLDRPSLIGRVNIEGGEFFFSGYRYVVRPGSIDFPSLSRINPQFDLEVETNPRASGQTFRVTIRLSGTFDAFTPSVTSEPWLSEADAFALLLGASPNPDRELSRLSPQQSQARLAETFSAQLLAAPLTARVGNVVSDVLPVDNVQITPVLSNETAFRQLDPSARVTIGKRISSNVYLTYSRSIAGAQNEIILLEYDQSDRVSWVLSRNEDRSFALDFRLRFVFR